MRSQRVGHDSSTSLSLFTFKEKQPRLRPVPVVCVLGREGGARRRGFPSKGWVKRAGEEGWGLDSWAKRQRQR